MQVTRPPQTETARHKFSKAVYQTGFSSALVFLVTLVGVFLVWQVPFVYTLDLGQNSDDWAVVRGFGDREQNVSFSFRWTVQPEAELRLPDVGWPSRVGLEGLAPRPDGKTPHATLIFGQSNSFLVTPAQTSLPPALDGRLTPDQRVNCFQ